MADDPTPDAQDELPKHFVVRLEHQGKTHFIICETVVAFEEGKLFAAGAKALRTMFDGFRMDAIAEVAPLPPLGHPDWLLQTATLEVGDVGGGG